MDGKKLQLKAKHTWKCKPGYSICVLDRGVVRFEYPSSWIVEPKDGALHLYDRPSSVESCDLGVSLFPVSREETKGLPVDDTLLAALGTDWER